MSPRGSSKVPFFPPDSQSARWLRPDRRFNALFISTFTSSNHV